jgi:hypothetical protein
MLLKETDRVGAISDKAILIVDTKGTTTSYCRPYANSRTNQVLIFELL